MKNLFENIKAFFKGFKYGVDTGIGLIRDGVAQESQARARKRIRLTQDCAI